MKNKTDENWFSKGVLFQGNPIYDKVFPFLSLSLFVIAGINLFEETKTVYAVGSTVVAFFFLILYGFRAKLSSEIKLIIVNNFLLCSGAVVIYFNGLTTNGILLFLTGTILSTLFLPRAFTWFYGMGTSLYLLSIILWLQLDPVRASLLISEDRNALSVVGSTLIAYVFMLMILAMAMRNANQSMVKFISNLEYHSGLSEKRAQEAYQLAYYDQVTGLPNKLLFEKNVSEQLGSIEGTMALLDIRDYKVINSLFGNKVGERILTEFGSIIGQVASPDVIVARIGGNEFAVLVIKGNENTLVDVIKVICSRLNESVNVLVNSKKIKVYHAIVPFNKEDANFDTLYEKAILTMKACKDQPHLDYVIFTERLFESLEQGEHTLQIVEKALKDRSFSVHYQCKVNPMSNEVTGVEALARLFLDDEGPVSPGTFIPVIEKNNLAIGFGEQIIQIVFQDLPLIHDQFGLSCLTSINVSLSHLLSDGFVGYIEEQVRLYDIDRHKIVLEITEDVLMVDLEEVKFVLNTLRKLGYKLSLDDFGTGYSSLNYLASLPFDEIKIDQTFTRQLLISPNVSVMMQAIFSIAKAFRYAVVVEGVEEQEEVDVLLGIGDCQIQGYFYSKPESIHKT